MTYFLDEDCGVVDMGSGCITTDFQNSCFMACRRWVADPEDDQNGNSRMHAKAVR